METIAIATVGSLIVGDIFGLMGPGLSDQYEVVETKAETFGDGVTMTLKTLSDGYCRQANWHRLNNVCLLKTNFIPEVADPYQGRTLAEMLETAI